MFQRLMNFLSVSLVALALTACATKSVEVISNPPANEATSAAPKTGVSKSYRLRIRDQVRVGVIDEPGTLIERRISTDGTIDIPFLKETVAVAGMTITEAQTEIAKRYRRYFREPQVAFTIITYAERRVYVSGYVGKPGPVTIPPEETLTLGRALSMAGGVLPRGNRDGVTIKRILTSGDRQVITKDMSRIDSGEEPDFVLEDEDQIYIKDSRI
jgi:polysaccharide export outer membrane protein